jgi:GT2 family glycosyltransferase
VSLKRALFTEAGQFDTDFVFDYEDLDLAWRLGQHGMRLIYDPMAVAEHAHPYDWPSVVRRYESRASAERLMASKHDWFEPWFHRQMATAQREPRASRLWIFLADRVPARPGGIREKVRRRADRYYRQQLAPAFMEVWDAAGDPDEARIVSAQ